MSETPGGVGCAPWAPIGDLIWDGQERHQSFQLPVALYSSSIS